MLRDEDVKMGKFLPLWVRQPRGRTNSNQVINQANQCKRVIVISAVKKGTLCSEDLHWEV